MTEEELNVARLEVIEKLEEKYGHDKVQFVEDLDADITWKMMNGEAIAGVESWAYEIVKDFESMLLAKFNIKKMLN